jgi:hypothetical protein
VKEAFSPLGEITWGTAAATLAAPLVFLLPGWALLSLLLPRRAGCQSALQIDAASWLILVAGLTLAITPIALLALYLLRLQIGPGAVLVGLTGCALVIAWRQGPACLAWLRRPASWRERLKWPEATTVALAVITVLVLGVRLWVVRGIDVGFWGDSYQHTMISQLILDNGGLFQSWAPYVPLTSFTYHFGFHGNVALFQWASGWLTGNATPRTVVLVGQFLNALAVLALYPLAVRLSGGRRWAGVATVLLAGLVSEMPMFYANWGRYTQLTGQVILPVALWLTMEAVGAPRWDARRVVAAALATAGLGLTHYRIAVFYFCFLVIYLVYRLVTTRGTPRHGAVLLGRVASVGIVAGLLAAPWIWHLRAGALPHNLAGYHQGVLPGSFYETYNSFDWDFSPAWLAWLALAGAVWMLFRRRPALLIPLWAGSLLLVPNLHWLGLPSIVVVDNFTVMIGFYMPVCLAAGFLAGDWLGLIVDRWPRTQALVAILAVVLAGVAAPVQAKPLDPEFQLVTPADELAMAWIRENTAPDAKFLANSFFAFGDYVIVGSDAGWWIPLLTGRRNTVPPATYSMETADPADYRERVNAVARRIEEGSLDDPEMVSFLRSQGITHVYIGQVGGPLLDADVLRRSAYYDLVYDREGVFIFALHSSLQMQEP